MLANTKKLLLKAQKGKYAVAHFNINNMEIAQAAVRAGEKCKAPIILATTGGAVKYAGMDYLYAIAQVAANKSNIPIALHLDHGKDPELVKKAIRKGYSSVMIDASMYDLKKNIRVTKQIVQMAHRRGISVEAELGTISGTEDLISAKRIILTNPEDAKDFVSATGCDFLAVAIGTSHGAFKFKSKSKLRIDVLRDIGKKVKTPLVLHGASAVPKKWVSLAKKFGAQLGGAKGVHTDQLKKAIKAGITKVNTDTDLRIAFDAGVREFLKKKPKDYDPRHILGGARRNMCIVAEERIKLFGSRGKA